MLLGSEANNVVKERGGVGLMCEAYRLAERECACVCEEEGGREGGRERISGKL